MTPDDALFDDPDRGASIDTTGVYRYGLWRGPDTPDAWRVVFVMLNPSTADGQVDDPTIRRCLGYAHREAALRGQLRPTLEVVNLFAWRATEPLDLVAAARAGQDIDGPDNDLAIEAAVRRAAIVVAGWGAAGGQADHRWSMVVDARAADVVDLIREGGRRPLCLGVTKSGHPRHPLYVRADAPLLPWAI